MNKKIQFIGLVIFLIGFTIFNSVFFLGKYQLTSDILQSKVTDEEKREVLIQAVGGDLGKEYNQSFPFVSMLNQAFEKANTVQLEKYKIRENEINEIAELAFPQYSVSVLDEYYSGSEGAGFKQDALKNYSSWMEGRSYENIQTLKEDLINVSENISRYEIAGKKGFDKYQVKNLKFSITKSSDHGPVASHPLAYLLSSLILIVIGAVIYFIPYAKAIPGIKNDGIFKNVMTNRGWLGIVTGTYLILYYIFLYFYPEYMTTWVSMVDPVSMLLKGSEAGQFFLYGFMYTIAILVMGIRMLWKYRHSRYQQFRTVSVMFFQLAFAFLIPEILLALNQPYFDFKNIWPLDYDFFFDTQLSTLMNSGALGIFMLFWGIVLIIIGVPLFTYFFGKRWYCSWVCGCGGLAETLGDPYRQLSDKSLKAWKIERYLIHSILVFAVVMTAGVLYTYWTGQSNILGISTYNLREIYGVYIGAGFAGVVGTGFYPFMGNRVWCRFGCPLAAYLGMIQRFKSRFRITTNGGQCISCGNCSTYCEMGIDVRWYAQRGQNIVRSSCVGCGICSSVCPRGVLNLENREEAGRFGKPILIGQKNVTIAD